MFNSAIRLYRTLRAHPSRAPLSFYYRTAVSGRWYLMAVASDVLFALSLLQTSLFIDPPPPFLHPITEWPDRLIFIISSLIVCRRCRSLPRFYPHQMFLITNSTSTEESQTIRSSMFHKWIRLHIKLLYSNHAFFLSYPNWQSKGLWVWRVPGFFVSGLSPSWALFLPPLPVRKLNYLRGGWAVKNSHRKVSKS